MEDSDNTLKTDSKPWLWKKGFCPNPGGRPKGKSLKEYSREYLASLNDEEKDEFLEGLPKETIWKMGEGNFENKTDITSGGETINQVLVKFVDGKSNETTKNNTNTK